MLQKLASLYSRYFMSTIEYRVELLLWIVHDLIPTVTLIFIWTQLYRESNAHGAYTLPEILQYYLLVTSIGLVTSTHFDEYRAQQVRQGKIDGFLIKPLGYFWQIAVGVAGNKSFYICLVIPLLAALWWIVDQTFGLPLLHLSFVQVFTFILLVFGGFLVEFLTSLLVVILSFWFEGAEGLVHFKWLSIGLFSGWIIPITLMPEWLQTISSALPFQYMYSVPISILQGKTQLSGSQAIYFAISISFLIIVSAVLWKRAMMKYASAGG